MNKKLKRLKKEVKRNLREIGFKKSCKNLKKKFLKDKKTAIFNNGFFHPSWEVFPQPAISELENGYIVDGTEAFLPLSINRATKEIIRWKRYSKVVVSCYNFSKKEESWFTI